MSQKNGTYVEYHLNSNIPCLMSEYSNGMKIGDWTLFYSDGNIHIKCHYENNLMNGQYIEYSTSGTILKKGNMLNGNKVGTWIEVTEMGNYDENGERHGTWIRKRFNLIKTSKYNNGIITSIM